MRSQSSIRVEQVLWRPEFFTPDQCQQLGRQLLADGLSLPDVSVKKLIKQQARTEGLVMQGKQTNTVNPERLLPGMGLAVVLALHKNVDPKFVSNGARHLSLRRLFYLQCMYRMESGLPEFQVGADYSTCYDAQGMPLDNVTYRSSDYVITQLQNQEQHVSKTSSDPKTPQPLEYGMPVYWSQSHLEGGGFSLQHGGEQDKVEAVFVQASSLMPELRQVVGRMEELGI